MLTLHEHIEEGKKIVESFKKRGEGVSNLVANLYSDPSHFIFELLQNAEDAYQKNVKYNGVKKVVFELTKEGISIYHNGKPFDETDLKLISSLANIDNVKREDVNQIGKFGIGFKSVFSITDTPYIYSSNGYSFILRDYLVLEEVEHPPTLDFTTKFYLPLIPGKYEVVKEGLEKLDALSLLFLDQISLIEINIEGQEPVRIFKKPEKENQCRIEINDEPYNFILFSSPVTIDNKETKVKLSYFLKNDTIAPFSVFRKPSLFVYFGTDEKTELELLLHGPFGTTPSREKVPLDDKSDIGKQNLEILKNLASSFITSLYKMKKKGLLTVDLWKILPTQEKTEDVINNIFYNFLSGELRKGAVLIPDSKGGYTNTSNGALAKNKKIPAFLSAKDLIELFDKKRWVDTSISEDAEGTRYLWEYFADTLEMQEIDIRELVKKINDNDEFIGKKSDQWLKSFYALLLDLRDGSEVLSQIRKMNIIRTADGSHIAPFIDDAPNAFLFLPDFPKENIVKKCFIEDDESRRFLTERLKLTVPDKVDSIINKTIRKYINPKRILKKQNTEDINHILSALNDKKISTEKLELLRVELRSHKIIRATNAKSRKIVFKKPYEVYLPTKQNKAYFKSNPGIWFPAVEISSEKLEKLGCLRDIKLRSKSPIRGTSYVTLAKYWGEHKRGEDLFDPDAKLDGLEFALKHLNKERSKIIWKTLLQENNYKKVGGRIQKCKHQNFPIDEIEIEEELSPIGKLLTEHAWIYVKNRKSKPSNLYFSQLDKKVYDLDGSAPKLLSEKLGFKHDIRQQAEALGYVVLDKKDKDYKEFLKFKKQKEQENKIDATEEPQTPIDSEPTINTENALEITHGNFSDANGNGSPSPRTHFNKHDCRDGTPREKRFFLGLKNEYLKNGFSMEVEEERKFILKKGNDQVEIVWCNSETANRVGYDFEINQNGTIEKVIELKTTRADIGAHFVLSGPQWDKARDMHLNKEGKKYEVFCVYKADQEKPKTAKIIDPFGNHLEKRLKIIEVCISPRAN
jgi:hypothetical protein